VVDVPAAEMDVDDSSTEHRDARSLADIDSPERRHTNNNKKESDHQDMRKNSSGSVRDCTSTSVSGDNSPSSSSLGVDAPAAEEDFVDDSSSEEGDALSLAEMLESDIDSPERRHTNNNKKESDHQDMQKFAGSDKQEIRVLEHKRSKIDHDFSVPSPVETKTGFQEPDPNVYCVYPVEANVMDAVTVYRSDLERLEPHPDPEDMYLNDSLVDIKIKYTLREETTRDTRRRIHTFNCMFYTR
jgi:Ulp1 family protease